MKPSCGGCRFFSQTLAPGQAPESASGGECRKRAPVIGRGQWADRDCAPYAYWPNVSPKYWCGDFRASALEKAKAEKKRNE